LHELGKDGKCEVCGEKYYFNLVTGKCEMKMKEVEKQMELERVNRGERRLLEVRRSVMLRVGNERR
jgi:hypothetical protein